MLDYSDMPGWCAGIKVNGVSDTYVTHPTFPSVEKMMKEGLEEVDGSALCITVNAKEERVLKWLKDNKFRKGPSVKNWGHGGRATMMYFKQIPRSLWRTQTGQRNEYGDYD